MDQKDIDFIEDTVKLFDLPLDHLKWNDKNIEDWFYWIRHKFRFKFPKISKDVIDFRTCSNDLYGVDLWKERYGAEVGGYMFREFSMWIKYKTMKSKLDPVRRHTTIDYIKPISDKPRRRNEKKDGLYLWQILLGMLFDNNCVDFITWTDYRSGMFKIKNPNAVSIIWGESKNNHNMTYDKMSRSMRQYYKSNLLKKTNHDKLNYCFNMEDSSVKKFINRCKEKSPDIRIPSDLHRRSLITLDFI